MSEPEPGSVIWARTYGDPSTSRTKSKSWSSSSTDKCWTHPAAVWIPKVRPLPPKGSCHAYHRRQGCMATAGVQGCA